jgi:2-keto-4-pentenoate hydratase/2-oxohepta-3-ene-1,7-dioic acid hydratase in catechol pathway
MGWPFEELLSYASRGTQVRPGDVLGSGTCGNGGCLAELWGRRGEQSPPPLRPGDVVEMSVEAIGTIQTASSPAAHCHPSGRRGSALATARESTEDDPRTVR